MNKNRDTSPRYRNDNQTGQYVNKWTVTIARARETVESDETDEEPDEQELEAHYMYMEKIKKVLTAELGPTFDAEPLEHVLSNPVRDENTGYDDTDHRT
ncbi:hypothetical protein Tco_1225771 [Tanacetum coccineum]